VFAGEDSVDRCRETGGLATGRGVPLGTDDVMVIFTVECAGKVGILGTG
jgi:hypothetical protein